jgi:glycogen(starch) synthase
MTADRQPQRVLMTADPLGGVWTFALELIRGLPAIEFTLASMGGSLSPLQRAEVDALENVSLRESEFQLEWMDDPWGDLERAGEWLLQIAREVAPDLIHLNGYSYAALPWNAPVLVVAHSCIPSWWRATKGTGAPSQYDRYRSRVTAGLNTADLIVAPTRAMLDSLQENYAADFDGRVIHNGRSHTGFSPRPKLPKIFAAGRLWDEAKNITLLNEVAPRVRWPIEVAGENVHPSGITALRSNVQSLGKLSPQDLARHFAESAIYAGPALYEPFGLSILEAGLCSCALVLSDIPSLRELWDDAAVFVPTTDPDALVRAFDALIDNAIRREEMGLRARERGLHFTVDRMASGYRAAYAHCLASRDAEVVA